MFLPCKYFPLNLTLMNFPKSNTFPINLYRKREHFYLILFMKAVIVRVHIFSKELLFYLDF